MSAIKQGTTPSLMIRIKASDFAVSEAVKLRLAFVNKGTISIKTLEDVVVDASQNAYIYTFTEAETLALAPQSVLSVDGRVMFSNGSITGINEMTFDVEKSRDTGVMTE